MKKSAVSCISIFIFSAVITKYTGYVGFESLKIYTDTSRNQLISIGVSIGIVLGSGLIFWSLEKSNRVPEPFNYIPAGTKREDWYILGRAHIIRNEDFFFKRLCHVKR